MKVVTTPVAQGNRTLFHCDFHMEPGDVYPTFVGNFVEWCARHRSHYFKVSLYDVTGRLHTATLVEGKAELECFMAGLQAIGAFPSK